MASSPNRWRNMVLTGLGLEVAGYLLTLLLILFRTATWPDTSTATPLTYFMDAASIIALACVLAACFLIPARHPLASERRSALPFRWLAWVGGILWVLLLWVEGQIHSPRLAGAVMLVGTGAQTAASVGRYGAVYQISTFARIPALRLWVAIAVVGLALGVAAQLLAAYDSFTFGAVDALVRGYGPIFDGQRQLFVGGLMHAIKVIGLTGSFIAIRLGSVA